ncbi:Basic leucine zipper (bZIP) transcription factor atfB-like protein [Elsinoe fawcettii]|nr:Basic leucine zipper (bZIP) transcription factor atfB-like protein [Elsinoe fawcettii]
MPRRSAQNPSPPLQHSQQPQYLNLHQPQAINPIHSSADTSLLGYPAQDSFNPALPQAGFNQPTMLTDSVHQKFGQITPPEDHWKQNWESINPTINPDQFMATRERSQSGDSSSSLPATSSGRVDKKDKYREKNRVAAAKCRAKKKEHVDGLEENHRTQSMLNALLKQTEQNLRDELSFWRTQALQHAFCDCSAVQEYNLKKARALAADKNFGDQDLLRRDSMNQSPTSKVGNMGFYQQPHPDFDAQPS